jgi:hypothetical protein
MRAKGKFTVQLPLSTLSSYVMEWVVVTRTFSLQSAVDGRNGQLQAANSFRPQNSPWNGGWVRTKPGLDDLEKRRKCLDPDGPVHSLVRTAAMPYHFMTTDTPVVTEVLKVTCSKLKRTRKCVAVLLGLGREQNWCQIAKSHTPVNLHCIGSDAFWLKAFDQ